MNRPQVSSLAQYGRPLAFNLVEITSKQVRSGRGSVRMMRPPQRTLAPVWVPITASCAVSAWY